MLLLFKCTHAGLRFAVCKGCRSRGQREVVQVVQLAVVVCAGGRAQVQVGAAQELGLDLAGAAARLLAVGLEEGSKRSVVKSIVYYIDTIHMYMIRETEILITSP